MNDEERKKKHKLWKRKYRATHPEYIKRGLINGRKYDKIKKHTVDRKYNSYVHGAKKRGHAFNLTKEYTIALFLQPCYYCGVSAQPLNGIDRVDNTKGYSETNCVPCCKVCNRAKFNMNIDQFESWLKQICKFRRKKK